MTLEKILEEALKLRPDQRAELAHKMWDTIEDAELTDLFDPEVAAEIDRRLDEGEVNPGKLSTVEEVVQRARRHLDR
jgi:putative addiction module component (TIGR02574 family)